MATITERKTQDGRVHYRAQIRVKGYPAISETFERKTDAKLWAIEKEAEIRQGKYFKTAEAQKHTLADTIARYKRDILPHRKSDVSKVGMHLDWWAKHLGPYMLSDITPPVLSQYRDKLASETNDQGKTKSPSTVNRYIASLSITLSHAVEWGWLDENPMFKVKKKQEPRGRVRFLTQEEISRLLKECKNSKSTYLYPIVVLALSTGARWGEIVKLSWQNVDLKNQVIRLEQTKNGERRTLYLREEALRVVTELSHKKVLNARYVFPSQDGKTHADIRDGWELALKRAGITDFRFHDLRHTAASLLAMNGISPLLIAELLGHKQLSMVKRYAHLSNQHVASMVEEMNKQLFSAPIEPEATQAPIATPKTVLKSV